MSEENHCPQCGAVLPAQSPQGLCPGCLLKWGLESQTGGEETASQAGAADRPPPAPEEIAAHFPDLEILELVGRGGMGVVYKARQKRLDRLVALKILAPKVGQDPAFAERFAREARAMAMLSHPHVVAVYDSGQTPLAPPGKGAGGEGSLYYFLMEFVDGVNLRRLLDTGKLAPEEALAIVPQICEALQYAHDHGVVHRDIKPENVLLDKEGRVKIADFGIAKLVGKEAKDLTLTGAGQIVGTPQYMAPEQIEHPLQVDHRADIYSLGVVFYQMLTGELPIGRFAPPSKKVEIDVRLDEVVLRALEKEPQRRYQQAGEIRTQVETIARTPGPGPADEAQGSGSPPRMLNVSSSYVTTPEQLATFSGQFFIRRRSYRMVLDDRELSFARTGTATVIPLRAIRDLSVGHYPRVMNPVGLDLISVTYEEGGQTRRLFFSPYESRFQPPWHFNQFVGEWFNAIRAAVTAATGREPLSTPSRQLGVPRSSVLIYLVWLLPLLLAAMPLMALVRISAAGAAAPLFQGISITEGIVAAVLATITIVIACSRYGWKGPAAGESQRGLSASQTGVPRLSKTALTGAVAGGPLFLVVVLALGGIALGMTASVTLLLSLLSPLLMLLLAMAIGVPVLGYVALNQIRRSAGGLCGLELALFDLVAFPLLALDAAIAALGMLAVRAATGGPGGAVALFSIVVACVVVDVAIVRWAWRAVSQPPAGTPSADQSGRAARQPMPAVAALVLTFCLGVLGLVFLLRSWMDRVESAQARISIRIFETDAKRVGELAPGPTRQPGQLQVRIATGRSEPQTAEVRADVLARLLADGADSPGLLEEQVREGYWWPQQAIGSHYFRRGKVAGDGHVDGSLAVWRQKGVRRLRAEFNVLHGMNSEILGATFGWEGNVPPPNAARAFFIPFSRTDGTARYLVIALEVREPRAGEARDTHRGGKADPGHSEQDEHDQIVGTWKVVDSSSWDKMFKNVGAAEDRKTGIGVPVTKEEARTAAQETPTVITRDTLFGLYQYRLDGSKNPRAIDVLLNGKMVMLGIYELQGDRLQFHFTKRPERPTSFAHHPDSADDLSVVLERVTTAVDRLDGALSAAAAAEATIGRVRRFDPGMRVGTIAFSPDGKRIAVGNDQPTMIMMRGGHSRVADNWQPAVRIVDAETGRPLASLRLTTAEEDAALAAAERFSHFEVTSLAFSPDGTVVAVGTGVGQAKLFDVPTGGLLRSLDDEKAKLTDKNAPEEWKSLKRAMGNVASLVFSPDGSLLGVCGSSFADYSYSGAFDGISRTGMRATGPGRLKLWEVRTGTLKYDLAGHSQANAAAFSPDGKLLASAGSWMTSSDGKTGAVLEHGTGVVFWDVRSGKKIGATTTSVSGWTRAVAFSPGGTSVAVGAQHFSRGGEDSSGRVSLAQVASGNVDWFQAVPGWAAAVAFSPDGMRVVVLCGRNTVRLLDTNTGQVQSEIKLTDFVDERGRYPVLSVATQSHRLAIGGLAKNRQGCVEVRGFHAVTANAVPGSAATSTPD